MFVCSDLVKKSQRLFYDLNWLRSTNFKWTVKSLFMVFLLLRFSFQKLFWWIIERVSQKYRYSRNIVALCERNEGWYQLIVIVDQIELNTSLKCFIIFSPKLIALMFFLSQQYQTYIRNKWRGEKKRERKDKIGNQKTDNSKDKERVGGGGGIVEKKMFRSCGIKKWVFKNSHFNWNWVVFITVLTTQNLTFSATLSIIDYSIAWLPVMWLCSCFLFLFLCCFLHHLAVFLLFYSIWFLHSVFIFPLFSTHRVTSRLWRIKVSRLTSFRISSFSS